MAHIRVDELIVIDNMEQRAVLHGINADILRLVVIVRAISCELHANRAGVRIDRDYLLLSAVRRVIGEIKHAIIDRAALYAVGAVDAADVIAAVLLGELFRHGIRPDLQAVHFIVELREPREIHRSYRAGAVEILAVIAVA